MALPAKLLTVDDLRFEAHVAQTSHPERPERLTALRSGLSPLLQHAAATALTSREATFEELARAHAPEHVRALLDALSRPPGMLDADTYFSAGSREAALLAAGSGIDLTRKLLQTPSAAGVCLVRPPGHHATRARAMGFCLLNNIAVAAHAALEAGAARVAIVDFDVHHGNGTQDIFYDDPRVLFLSLHQWPLYPGTGQSHEVGRGQGLGKTINLPLPAGAGSSDYAAAFERVVLPVLESFRPELTLVSMGFDAHELDPLASMRLQHEDFAAMTSALWDCAVRLHAPRLALFLEGGYSLSALEHASAEIARALTEAPRSFAGGRPTHGVERAIDATRRALSPYWEL